MNILLVDSVSSYREEVAQKLKQLGYHAVGVDNASQAIDVILNQDFNIVVMDNDLPEQTGMELVAAIRDVNQTAQLILIVDPLFKDEPAKLRRRGVTRLVRGPISPQNLVNEINNLISGPTSRPARSHSEPPSAQVEMISATSIDAHIKAVRRNYQERLPSELERLRSALVTAHQNPTARNLDVAHGISHTLHGTAGTLGFHEISDITGYIDSMLKKMLAGQEPDVTIWDDIFNAYKRAETVPERLSLVLSIEPHTNNVATILVADRDEKILKTIAEIAHTRCIDVRPAWTKTQALDWVLGGRLDGVILDVDFTGDEHIVSFIERIKENSQMRNVPIALMARDAGVDNRVAAAHVGATHFLSNPPSAEELTDVVQQFIVAREQLTYKVLVVDDDEPFREHIGAILRESGFSVTTLGEPKKIMETAESVKPDIMLLDIMMPDISGFDVCRMLRSTTGWKELPILFLTAEADPKVRLECFRAGGDDYIKKPVLKEELLARINVRTERIRLYKERADKDALTSLPTRRAFVELFRLRTAEGNRFNRAVSLCLIDIDHFKYVNDTYGHLTGDRVLASLGSLLASRFRAVDIRGRWGGEEFTVVFYNEGRETAKLILSRLLEEFRSIEFEGEHKEKFFCTFSCGIAELPRDGKTTDELFRVADERLYAAKESGRNCIITD